MIAQSNRRLLQMIFIQEPIQELVLYWIRILHPSKWLLQFNPTLYPLHGSVDLFEPSPVREAALTILWRPMDNPKANGHWPKERTARLYSHREQVILNLDRYFRKWEVLSSRELNWCGHFALEDQISATYKRGILKKKKIRLTRIQRILMCPETERIVFVYGSCSEDRMDHWSEEFEAIFKSFHCHWNKHPL